jgi:Xaa-Pro aminopeptidase
MNKLIKKFLKDKNLDFFILSNNDEFSSEYAPDSEKRVEYISNFTGSNAVIIFCQKGKNAFFTDGRYTNQARQEIDSEKFEIFDLSTMSWQKFLQNFPDSQIGFDPKLHNIYEIVQLQKNHPNLFPIKNPIDNIWQNDIERPRPKAKKAEVFIHDLKFCGESWQNKLKKIQQNIKNNETLILNCPNSIAWLFNIRAHDINHIPAALIYALIEKESAKLFIDKSRLNKISPNYLENIEIYPPQLLLEKIQQNQNQNFITDFSQCNFAIYQFLQKNNIIFRHNPNPCILLKAKKNPIEVAGAKACHQEDSIAVNKLLSWIEENKNNDICEISVAQKLLEFRRERKYFIEESFPTISAFGSNGAIIHYHPKQKTNKKIKGNGLFLLDSGGNYLNGTTDVTRTIAIGNPTTEQKINFTLVLKGHIRLAIAKFPKSTTGGALDALARFDLWQEGKNYAHGTGHGVGNFLSVHEGPQSISSRISSIILEEGMILSNEPGYYVDNEYGIRIENLMIVKEFNENFLEFETLTSVPIDINLVEFSILTEYEKKWLKNYNTNSYL